MVRFIHTADWQVGKPYLQVKDDQKRFKLKQERLNVIDRIKDVVISAKSQFVVVAGDLFDSPTPSLSTVTEVLEKIGSLKVQVIVIPGNHDHGALGTIWHSDNFKKYKNQIAPNLLLSLEKKPIEIQDAVILPCPLLRKKESSDPTYWIRTLDWKAISSTKPRIILAHGGVQNFKGHDYIFKNNDQPSSRDVINLKELPENEVDYIALGDWHNGKQVGNKAWYSGTPEADRFNQGEGEQRGQVLQVDVKRRGKPNIQYMPTGRLQWHNICFHFKNDKDIEILEQKIQDITEGHISRDLLRLEISGVLSLKGHVKYEALKADLENKLIRLRVKGECYQSPKPDELEQLTKSAENPLIAQVAYQLQDRLKNIENKNSEEASITRIALCELYRFSMKA